MPRSLQKFFAAHHKSLGIKPVKRPKQRRFKPDQCLGLFAIEREQ